MVEALFVGSCPLGDFGEYFVQLCTDCFKGISAFIGIRRKHGAGLLVGKRRRTVLIFRDVDANGGMPAATLASARSRFGKRRTPCFRNRDACRLRPLGRARRCPAWANSDVPIRNADAISVFKDFNSMSDVSPGKLGWPASEFRCGPQGSYTHAAKIRGGRYPLPDDGEPSPNRNLGRLLPHRQRISLLICTLAPR